MHTDQIRYLSAINEKHSLNKASQELNVSPQALKLSLDALEREFGTKLVDRSRKGTYLNETGKALLALGADFLKGVDALKAQSPREKYLYLPHIKATIYTTPGLANTVVAKSIADLTVTFPESDIALETVPYKTLLKDIELGKKDTVLPILSIYRIGSTMLPDLNQHSCISFEPIVQSDYYCSIPNSLSISNYNSISMKTILKHPILIYAPTEDLALPIIKMFGEPKRIRSVKEFPIYFDMLQNDQESLSFAQLFKSQETLITFNNRRMVPIKEDIKVQIGFLKRTRANITPDTEELASFIGNYLRKHYI